MKLLRSSKSDLEGRNHEDWVYSVSDCLNIIKIPPQWQNGSSMRALGGQLQICETHTKNKKNLPLLQPHKNNNKLV